MREWLTNELEKVKDTYLIKATNMTGPYHRETALKKEYDGRQLLELVQNADDEADEVENPSVLIKLEEKRLVVANNGKPFSKSGIRSLIDSDNSPKRMSCKKIGYKGLGFRTVLNWSDSIWIKSGGFSIEFSRANAVNFFKKLLNEKPILEDEMRDQFGAEYRYDGECPIATLAVPSWKDTWDFDTSKYDTYVVINFSDGNVKDDIQRQINNLGMEVALFLNNLKNIVLDSPERKQTIERVQDGADEFDEIRILDEHSEVLDSRRWQTFSRSGKLPEIVRSERKAEQYEYDLRIAVSENMDDNVNRLFTYFRTEVKFPFPAIVHGTFELDDTRNHLVKSPTNTFLLQELANLMIDSAIKLTQTGGDVNWDAMKLLAKRGEFDDKIQQMGFHGHLLDKMKSQKLIPVLSKRYMSVEEGLFFYSVPFVETLKNASDIFPDLAIYTDDVGVLSLIKDLELGVYQKEQFIEKINIASDRLSIDERVYLILLIADNYGLYFQGIEPKDMPSLLIDEQGRTIKSTSQALLPPERSKFSLPSNIKINFVSEYLSRLLRERANFSRARELASKLNCFNLDEYRFDTVIRRIVAVTTKLIKNDTSRTADYTRNMLLSLFQIYSDDPEAAKQFPSNVNVRILSRSGIIRGVREMYFGREYSTGRIMEALYSKIDDTVFVPGIQQLGLEVKLESEVIKFLKWMGVEEYPRIVYKAFSRKEFPSEYEDYVLRNLPYTYSTDRGEVYSSFEELMSDKAYYSSNITTAYVNELDDILLRADFEDILAWLHSDHRVKQIIESGHEPGNSSFGIWLHNKQTTRDVEPKDISAFILWKLMTSEWIRTTSGNKVRPPRCCLSRTIVNMSPLIEIPEYEIGCEIFREHGIKKEDIEYILEKIGAARDFGRLADETIYSLLTNLVSVDPQGKKARSIYRQIIQSKPKEWARDVKNTVARNRFIKEGKLLARHEGKLEYLPVKDVYYVDNITFCKQVMSRFPMAQIDIRSGKDQVENIFGVAPLEDIHFNLAGLPKIHQLNSVFSRAFEIFKPYVMVYRFGKPTFSVELNRLKKLKIVLCTEIPATYEFGDKNEDLRLGPYEHIYISGKDSAYLLLEAERHREIVGLKKDISFCEAVAEILMGVLKVGENRKDYRDLFPKLGQERDQIIRSDLDDPDLEMLRKTKDRFRGLTDLELEFWESVLRAKGKTDIFDECKNKSHIVESIASELNLDFKFVKELYESIYYEDYSRSKNLPLFKRLFRGLGISVYDFNLRSLTQIDFSEHLRSEFENEKCRLKKQFKSFVYVRLKGKGLKDKEAFVKILEAFDNHSIESPFDINIDLEPNIQECFNAFFEQEPFCQLEIEYEILLEQRDCDPDEEYAKNKELFEQRVVETGGAYAEDIESFLNVAENRSLLYFEELGELVKRFDKKYPKPSTEEKAVGEAIVRKKKSISLNGIDLEYEEDDYEALSSQVDEDLNNTNYDIESRQPSKTGDKNGEGATARHGRGGDGGMVNKQAKEIGFLGEKYVYEILMRKYTKEKVFWTSHYARLVNVNPEGRDDIGYDMWYTDDKGERHYVEVKASKYDELGFSISKAEIRFGEKHKSNYEVILVLNVCDRNRNFFNLGTIFDYKEEESFSNNNKFKVDTQNFRISFE